MNAIVFDYRLAVAVVDGMEKTGRLSAVSAGTLRTKLARKYKINSGSIFAA